MTALRDAFHVQATACAALGSPFMHRILTLLADHWPAGALARKCEGWTGDIGPGGASLPLRIAGGLHALVLSGRDATLTAAYPPNDLPDPALRDALLGAVETHAKFLCNWIENAPQTNEVRRSAVLIAAGNWLADHTRLPIAISELGASGGLNLMWDHFALQTNAVRVGPEPAALTLTPDWTGPQPVQASPRISNRRGVDLNPLNAADPADQLRLYAYLWPDQPQRLAWTKSAIGVQDAPVDKSDAIDWLEDRLAQDFSGQLHLIYHTVAWQYFPAAAQARGRAMIEAKGQSATDQTPLAWLSMENDGAANGAALTLRFWPGDLRLDLGRADFHGRWVNWIAPQIT